MNFKDGRLPFGPRLRRAGCNRRGMNSWNSVVGAYQWPGTYDWLSGPLI
jgi:hypothetical protein